MKFVALIPTLTTAAEVCADAELNELCVDTCQAAYIDCVASCESESECIPNCTRIFDSCSRQCPCSEECPNGCTDCPNEICHMTTVLSLNTYGTNNAFLLRPRGNDDEYDTNVEFAYNEQTEVFYSCYAVFQGRKFVFGGEENPLQISVVDGCQLTRLGDLAFEFYEGACLNWSDESMVFCFDHQNNRQCYTSTNMMEFVPLEPSSYEHSGIQIANYSNTILAVGGSTSTTDAVESYDGVRWSTMSPYPYSAVLYKYAVVSTSSAVYYYGGYDGEDFQSQIAKFEDNQWSQVGNLKTPSAHHSVIEVNGGVLLVGGYGRKSAEFCTIDSGNVTCEIRNPKLTYYFRPALFLVPDNYCQ